MNISDYLLSQVKNCSRYDLTPEDKDQLDRCGIEEFIYKKLTSKKFRKWAVDELSEKQAKQALHLNISQNKPLQFRFPFGGYKLWRIPTSPQVDWAEFFSIAYYLSYLAPIATVYEPGIEFLFSSDDMIIERMDNIPSKDTNSYFNSFKELLKAYRKYLPSNMKVDIVRIGDLFEDKEVMEKELAENVDKVRKTYETADDKKKSQMYTTSELNINWAGAKDLSNISEKEKREIVEMGPIYHDAYCSLSPDAENLTEVRIR